MKKTWNAEDFDQCYRRELDGFEDGFAHAARQGIPRFIEEYRLSRVKDAVAPWIVGGQRTEDGRQRTEDGRQRTEDGGNSTSNKVEKSSSHQITLHEDHHNGPTESSFARGKSPNHQMILDLGCGTGWYPVRLLEKWGFKGEIVGIDVSPYNIELFKRELAKRGIDQIKAMVGKAEDLPFENDSFDTVYATETLEHVESPADVFEEAYRVLKPGGEFIITTPSGPIHRFWNVAFFIPALIKRLFRGRYKNSITIYDRPMAYREIRSHFIKAGFKLIHYHKAVFLPHESYIRFFPGFMQYLMLSKANVLELLGPLTRYWGLHHIIRLQK